MIAYVDKFHDSSTTQVRKLQSNPATRFLEDLNYEFLGNSDIAITA